MTPTFPGCSTSACSRPIIIPGVQYQCLSRNCGSSASIRLGSCHRATLRRCILCAEIKCAVLHRYVFFTRISCAQKHFSCKCGRWLHFW